ncbi:unnamed protein product, partial [Rotaria magnacalcarata]
TNTPLVEDQCVVINIGTKLPDTRRWISAVVVRHSVVLTLLIIQYNYKESAALAGRCCHQPTRFRHSNMYVISEDHLPLGKFLISNLQR